MKVQAKHGKVTQNMHGVNINYRYVWDVSLAKSYRRLEAPWKREPTLVLKGDKLQRQNIVALPHGKKGWEGGIRRKQKEVLLPKYFLDSTSASKGSYSQSCSDTKL